MPRLIRMVWPAAAIPTAPAAVPEVAAGDPSACQAGVSGPVGTDPSTAGGVNVHLSATDSVAWCPAPLLEAQSDIAPETNYPERATSHSPSDNPVSNAISVQKLLTLAGVNPQTVGFTHVVRATGGWATLSRGDLSDQPPFQGGLKPIVWINGSETDYLRPLRSDTDTNAEDFVTQQGGAPIDLYVSSGPLLRVAASASPSTVAAHRPVSFAASVRDQTAADGTLTYTWSFQDGTSARGPAVRHRFAAPGTYSATVTVHGLANDSGGVSPPVPVTVGSPTKGGHDGRPAGTDRNTHAGAGGPEHSRGNHPGAAQSAKHTGGTGSRHRSGRSGARSRHRTGRSGAPSGSNQSTKPGTTSTPASTPNAPTTPTTLVTPSAPAATTPASASPARAVRPRRPRAPRRIAPQSSPAGTLVHGRLIADVIPVDPTQLATPTPSSQAFAPSARLAGGSVTPLAGIAAGAVILLLLGAGAGIELRSQRRPVAQPPSG